MTELPDGADREHRDGGEIAAAIAARGLANPVIRLDPGAQ